MKTFKMKRIYQVEVELTVQADSFEEADEIVNKGFGGVVDWTEKGDMAIVDYDCPLHLDDMGTPADGWEEIASRKPRKVSKVTFDLYLYGNKYENVEVDFSYDPLDEDYLHEEDGPWAGIEVDGKCYDVQIWDDPVANEYDEYVPSGKLKVSLVDEDGHWVECDDVDSDNFRLEYTKE